MRIVHAAAHAIIAPADLVLSGMEIDWETVSEIGQGIGALGTVISALALLGVIRSLRLQLRQTQASEEEVVRAMRNDLMIVALENDKYLPLWGYPASLPPKDMALHAYLGMEFSYFETALRNGRLTELELEQVISNIFQLEVGRDFWRNSRVVYLESGDAAALRLARIAERHFRNQTELAAIEASPAGPARPPISADLDFDTVDVAGLLPRRGRRAVLSTCLHLLRVAIWLRVGYGLTGGRIRPPGSAGS